MPARLRDQLHTLGRSPADQAGAGKGPLETQLILNHSLAPRLLIDRPALARAVHEALGQEAQSQSCQVALDADGRLHWQSRQGGATQCYDTEPDAAWLRRTMVRPLALLPFNWLLQTSAAVWRCWCANGVTDVRVEPGAWFAVARQSAMNTLSRGCIFATISPCWSCWIPMYSSAPAWA